MRLTKDGEKVLEEARKILEATEKISSMKGGSPRLTGNLGIAVDETLLQYRLVNVINNFRQMAPDVTIKVELGTAYSIKDRPGCLLQYGELRKSVDGTPIMFGGIRIVWFAEAENRKGTVLSSEPLPELKSFDVELHQRSFPVFQAVFGQTRDMYGKRHASEQ